MTGRLTTRVCRIRGCTREHARGLFCCRTCWWLLPRELRDAVWAAYRTHGVFSDEYLQAAENAEAYFEDRDAVDVGEVLA